MQSFLNAGGVKRINYCKIPVCIREIQQYVYPVSRLDILASVAFIGTFQRTGGGLLAFISHCE
ncbi:hypothetical protein WG66_009364 [Moniliophthora roreri]|nr:hypothetical protein WG66_009364 [Moniliophthora roreri]